MDQIIHILIKDIRRLRWEIAGTLLVTALLAWLNGDNRLLLPVSRQEQQLSSLLGTLQPLCVGAWWFLLVSLFHVDAIPGVRQFWLTRPYRRSSLLGAKLLFMVLFLNLPTLAADVLVLWRAGLPLGGLIHALLWKQVLFTVMLLVPAIGIAAVTTNIAQTVLGVLALVVLTSLLALISGSGHSLPGGLGWWMVAVQFSTLSIGGGLLLYWQFFRRKTAWSRALIAAGTSLFVLATSLIPSGAAFSSQRRFAHQPGVGDRYTIKPAPERGRMGYEPGQVGWQVARIALPVDHVLPAGLEMVSDGVEVSLTAPDGAGVETLSSSWTESQGKPWVYLSLDRKEFARIRTLALRVDVKVHATMFGKKQTATMPFGAHHRVLPQFGVCGSQNRNGAEIWCRVAFSPELWTRVALRDRQTGERSELNGLTQANYAPFHVDPGISPLNNFVLRFPATTFNAAPGVTSWNPRKLGVTEIEFIGMEPLDHVVRTVRLEGLRLEDFEVLEPL